MIPGQSAMTTRSAALAARRERLLMRSRQLRAQAAEDARGLQPAFAVADRVQDGWMWLRNHPEVVAGAALGLAVLRPRRAFRLGWRAWGLWQRAQGWRVVAEALRRFV